MNIFFLDIDPITAACYHNDKHVVKMPLETAQLLTTSLIKLGYKNSPYKAAHIHNPLYNWILESSANFVYLAELGLSLIEEYRRRYQKYNNMQSQLNAINWAIKNFNQDDFPKRELTYPHLAFGPNKHLFEVAKGDKLEYAVINYRHYYFGEPIWVTKGKKQVNEGGKRYLGNWKRKFYYKELDLTLDCPLWWYKMANENNS